MKFALVLYRAAATVLCIAAMGCGQAAMEEAPAAGDEGTSTPQFRVDPFWPKPLPSDWLIGRIAGMAVDSEDRILVLQRPGSLTPGELGLAQDPPLSMCCKPAPPVLVFDAEGNLLDSWGGPEPGYDWPGTEHGMFVDHNDNVWLGGEGIGDPVTLLDHRVHGEANPRCRDHMVLKFSSDGTFLLQIGEAGKTRGSNNTGCVPRFVEKERRPPLRHQGIRSGGNLRVFENLAQTLVAVDAP